MPIPFSDYIVYADESGDHSLEKIDSEYPIFCLALCIIKVKNYINDIVPAIQKLKFECWGHDNVILHERDIRKNTGDFEFLKNQQEKESFYKKLNGLIESAEFNVVSCVIKKRNLRDGYSVPHNPYDIALLFTMERVARILEGHGENKKRIFCVFEGRGKREDKELVSTFNGIKGNRYKLGYYSVDFKKFDFQIRISNKAHNSTGLQLADMIARPIGLNVLNPAQPNQAHDVIRQKYIDFEKHHKIFPQ